MPRGSGPVVASSGAEEGCCIDLPMEELMQSSTVEDNMNSQHLGAPLGDTLSPKHLGAIIFAFKRNMEILSYYTAYSKYSCLES